jgi:type I restriction enzyme S subunit
MRIPLPPLDEQRAVVAMFHGVTERVERGESERVKSMRAVRALGSSLLNYGTERSQGVPLGELVEWRQLDVDVEADAVYHFAGVYSFGRGVFVGPIKKGSEFSYKRLTRLHKDNFVYPKLMAWEGAFGIAGSEHEGLVVSPEFPVFELHTDRLLPETLQLYFEQPDVWRAISGASRGTNVRRRRLHPRTFLAHVMPLPSMAIQLELRKLVHASAQVAEAQVQVGANLEALVPSLINKFFTAESSRPVG